MGLDNGIVVYSKIPFDLPKEVKPSDSWAIVHKDGVDVLYEMFLCYWRKCWNVREVMLEIIADRLRGEDGKTLVDDSYFELTLSDIEKFYKKLLWLNKSKNWDPAESIWPYKDIKDTLDQQLLNLEWLMDYMRGGDKILVCFLDSY